MLFVHFILRENIERTAEERYGKAMNFYYVPESQLGVFSYCF